MRRNFGDRLRELRSGNSQAQIANVFGIRQTTYSSWETGTSKPDINEISNIAQYYKVSTDWLLGLTEKQPSPTTPTKPCPECSQKDEIITALSKSLENANASIRDLTSTVTRMTTEAPKKVAPDRLPRRKP